MLVCVCLQLLSDESAVVDAENKLTLAQQRCCQFVPLSVFFSLCCQSWFESQQNRPQAKWPRGRLISNSVSLSQPPAEAAGPVCCMVCLFTPHPTPYAGANLYWLVKEAMCVNNLSVITLDLSTWRVSITIALSLGIKYSMRDLIHDVDYCLCTRQCSGWDWTRNLQSQVQHPNHYATEPCTDSDNNLWWSWEPGFLLDVDTM